MATNGATKVVEANNFPIASEFSCEEDAYKNAFSENVYERESEGSKIQDQEMSDNGSLCGQAVLGCVWRGHKSFHERDTSCESASKDMSVNILQSFSASSVQQPTKEPTIKEAQSDVSKVSAASSASDIVNVSNITKCDAKQEKVNTPKDDSMAPLLTHPSSSAIEHHRSFDERPSKRRKVDQTGLVVEVCSNECKQRLASEKTTSNETVQDAPT